MENLQKIINIDKILFENFKQEKNIHSFSFIDRIITVFSPIEKKQKRLFNSYLKSLEKKFKISENEVKRLLFIKIKRIYIESYNVYRYQHIYINDNLKIKSLHPLINCINLEIITLFDQDIFDFDFIDSFKSLKELTITYNDKLTFENRIENFSKINNLHHLEYLNLDNNFIEINENNFLNLNSIKYLSISNTNITSCNFFSNSRNIKFLDISNCKIEDYKDLNKLKGLEVICLGKFGNNLESILDLANLNLVIFNDYETLDKYRDFFKRFNTKFKVKEKHGFNLEFYKNLYENTEIAYIKRLKELINE